MTATKTLPQRRPRHTDTAGGLEGFLGGVLARRAVRWLAVPVAAAALAAYVPGAAARAGSATESVTLVLSPPNRAALQALGKVHVMPVTVRRAQLVSLEPTAAQHRRVAAALTRDGLTVTGGTAFTVTARGPAPTVQALFGSAKGAAPRARFGTGLPTMPPNLRGDVTVALGGDETRPAAHRLNQVAPPGAHGYSGIDFRAAYDGGTPAAGGPGPETVATVQLSGWNQNDLASYAAGTGLANPLTNGQYTGISVDGATPWKPDGYGGDIEVGLDQEALLSTAPHAKQRAYFGPNTPTGFVDTIDAAAADATTSHIVALSISWASCEPIDFYYAPWTTTDSYGNSGYYLAIADAVSYAEAAGVTVFAGTGDTGVDGCYPYDYDPATTGGGLTSASQYVQLPSSLPSVVAVGGTRLTTPQTTPGETVWSDGHGDGTGGGYSAFQCPHYQQGVVANCSTSGTSREVPDIASDADVSTGSPGFEEYSSAFNTAAYSCGYTAHPGWCDVGGTSLGGPTQAALLANQLPLVGSGAMASGLGDIHDLLYSAPATDFRDITVGNNSECYPNPYSTSTSCATPTIPGFSASTGYDPVSGLGAPLWTKLVDNLDRVTLTSTATGPLPAGTASAATFTATVSSMSTSAAATAPTGTVQFYDVTGESALPLGSPVALIPLGSQATAQLTVNTNATAPNLPAGTRYVQAVYSGDGTYGTNYSPYVSQVVLASPWDATNSTYHGVTPVRVLDTRNGTGGHLGALPARDSVTFTLPVPSTATAAVLNVTAVQPTSGGYLTAYPAGTQRPATSNLNFTPGQVVANLVVTPTSPTTEQVSVYNGSGGTVQVVADLAGYYMPDSTGATYVPITPFRIMDTRSVNCGPNTTRCWTQNAPVNGVADEKLGPGQSVQLPIVSGPGAFYPGTAFGGPHDGQPIPVPLPVPASAGAIAINVTALNETSSGYLSVYPSGATSVTSTLNFTKGVVVPNMAITTLSDGGAVTIRNGSGGTVDVVIDLDGYYQPDPTQHPFTPHAPVRLLDSRTLSSPLGGYKTLNVQVTNLSNIPANSVAVVLNVTVTQPKAAGYLTVYPYGVTRPTASNLNFVAGQTVPNLVISATGKAGNGNGYVSIYNGSPSTVQVVVDLFGYYS